MNNDTLMGYVTLQLNTQTADLGDCWAEGYEGWAKNQEDFENPYNEGSAEHLQWEEGWWAAFYGEEPLHTLVDDVTERVVIKDKAEHTTQPWWGRIFDVSAISIVAITAFELFELLAFGEGLLAVAA